MAVNSIHSCCLHPLAPCWYFFLFPTRRFNIFSPYLNEVDVYLGNSLRVCYENSRCEDHCDNCYSGRITCNTWCLDYVPTEAGRYLINEPLYFDESIKFYNQLLTSAKSPA